MIARPIEWIIGAWSSIIHQLGRLAKGRFVVRICPIGCGAKKKEVSCSPQQEASRFWLFRTRFLHASEDPQP